MRFPWLAALCLAAASIADARPYGVDDMLRVESYGQALIDPDGRWAVIDRYRRYDSAASYRYDGFTRRGLGVVMRLDLQHGSRLEPLFPQDDGAGYWIASLSPSGKRVAYLTCAGDCGDPELSGTGTVWRVKLDGSGKKELFSAEGALQPNTSVAWIGTPASDVG